MPNTKSVIAATVLIVAVHCAPKSSAASLELSPVSIEVVAPTAAATMTLRNESATELNAQIRVFRWREVDGEEILEPTDDVVASPPMTTLAPKLGHTVRLVRVNKGPVSSGEAYRVLVDELPSDSTQTSKGVTLLMRYSVPVFFYAQAVSEGTLAWSIEERHGRSYLSATNGGDQHVRVSNLKIQDGNRSLVSFGEGLAGYVLGHSTKRWAMPRDIAPSGGAKTLFIVAQTNTGPVRVAPALPPNR